MKKFFKPILILLTTFTITSIIARPTFAATCSGVETSIIECEGGDDAGIWHILLLIVEIMSIGVGILALIGILIFGIQYLTAGGDVAKTTKAKRRLLEIVLGLVGWVVIFSFSEWLMPGGKLNFTSNITEITLNITNSSIETGETTTTTVTFNPSDTDDKTYSLSSDKPSIASVSGNTIKCESEGQATITATSVNNKISTATITCTKPTETANNSSSSNNNSNASSGKALTAAEAKSIYNSMATPSYTEVQELAASKGISKDNFTAMLAWGRIENHENTYGDIYFAYLCDCVGMNWALSYEKSDQPSGYLDYFRNQSANTWYHYADYFGRNVLASSSNGYYGYYPSNLKLVKMALEYPYPNIYGCSGATYYGGGYTPGSDTIIYQMPGASPEEAVIFKGTPPA